MAPSTRSHLLIVSRASVMPNPFAVQGVQQGEPSHLEDSKVFSQKSRPSTKKYRKGIKRHKRGLRWSR